MEYLIGFYVMGWVLCSLFIMSSIYQYPERFRDESKLLLFGAYLFTCFVWPVFMIYGLRKFKEERQR